MQYILSGPQMKSADRYTIEVEGVPSEELMLRAAAKVADVVKSRFSKGSSVLVSCGSGNNGGDGFAAAYLLYDAGYRVTVCYPGDPDKRSSECVHMMDEVEKRGISILDHVPAGEKYDVVLDALFGIGLTREIGSPYKEVLEDMNALEACKIAVDIASGISSDTGQVPGTVFCADLTVTFAYAKAGQYLYPGRLYTGELVIADIGIYGDPALRHSYLHAFERQDVLQALPPRPAYSNKGTYGRLLIAAGSEGMAGAAFLSALAAYRCGAGLVRIFTHESNRIPLQTLLPEAILTTWSREEELVKKLTECLSWATAVVCGPGMGTDTYGALLTETILMNRSCPCVLDADALNLIARKGYALEKERGALIVTPHLKEFSRLTGLSVAAIREDIPGQARTYAREKGVILVLKDAVTCVASPDGLQDHLNLTGSPVMAKGGSGDVLTGVIGALLAQKKTASEAASLGAWIHGKAGELLEKKTGVYSGLARELADCAGAVMCALKLDEKGLDV